VTNFLDSIIENLPSMLFVKQAKNLKFVQFNRAWEELLGIDRHSMIGKSDEDFLPKEQAEAFKAKDLEVLTTGVALDIPVEPIQTATKGIRLLHTRKIPVFGADGQPKYLLGMSEDITERKLAEDQIKASLEEKVVLLQEIHHRVKNNLQVISSLLYLQAGKIQDPQMLSILRDSQNRVKSMALIHEKLYQTKDLAKVDLGEYIHNLTSYLFRSYTAHAGAIQLRVQADNVSLGIDTAVPCGLIINELVSNALKHAFPENASGEIQIELHANSTVEGQGPQAQLFTLSVRDSGIGFPATVDFQNTASLGLQLVNTLVNQLDGVIELHNNNGTEFRIQFPNPS
jgi:PAS domain S-box-containing protein